MNTLGSFLQKGGYKQSGGISVTKLFEDIHIGEFIYDRKSFTEIKIENELNKDILANHVKIISKTNTKINLGLDRLLYGPVEETEYIYTIQIKYMDFNKIINVEGKENAISIMNNYGLILSFVDEYNTKTKQYEYNLEKQKIVV
jgi:hypothetical protein